MTNESTQSKIQKFLVFIRSKNFLKYFFAFSLIAVAGAFTFSRMNKKIDTTATEINWTTLIEYDYTTGIATPHLQALDGKYVRVPGFMVPLEDNSRKVTEFLLVPSPQACIHVPPPPANQMVFVKMETQGEEAAFGPIWIYGTLHLKAKKHMYGEASFSISGIKTTPYY